MLPIAYRDGVVDDRVLRPVRQARDRARHRADGLRGAVRRWPTPDDVDDAIDADVRPAAGPALRGSRPARRATPPRVGDLLVANGATTDEQIAAALAEQERTGSRLGDVLLYAGVVGEADLIAALAEQFQMPPSTSTRVRPRGGRATDPRAVARELRVVPVAATRRRCTSPSPTSLDDDDAADAASATPTWSSSRSSRRATRSTSSSRRLPRATTCLAVDDLRERPPEECAAASSPAPRRAFSSRSLLLDRRRLRARRRA